MVDCKQRGPKKISALADFDMRMRMYEFGTIPSGGARIPLVKRWNGWSKSIVLENKVAINFDFRSGAKKSSHLDYPLQSYGPKFVNMPKYA